MKKLVLISGLLLAFILVVQLSNAMGMSVLPAFIRMNVIRGQQFDIPISVSNSGNETSVYSIKALDNFAEWVHFYMENQTEQIDRITVPAIGSNTFIARFNIPKDVPNGEYSSSIYIETLSEGSTNNNTGSLSIKVPVIVSFEVTGSQFLTGKVLNITTADTEVNRILRIKTEFQNTGDVIAMPVIDITVKKNDAVVGSFTYNTTSVGIDSTLIIDSDWDTTGQTVGDYVADVKVYLNNILLGERNLDFKILERGTLTAEGKIEEVKASSEVETGQPSKIEVQFQNTGQIDITAKISGEVYQDNNFVDTIQGDETLIKVGENETLTAYFKPTKDGSYLIKSNVVYEGKKEPLSEISINAESSSASGTSSDAQNTTVIIFVVFVIVLIVVGILYERSKKRTKRK